MFRADEKLKLLYGAFNSRDIESALLLMQPDVVWANGIDGGYVHGTECVREYWLKQWSAIDSYVEILAVRQTTDRSASVDVHLTAFQLGGEKLFDTVARHVFYFQDGLIQRFETSVHDERV